MLSKQDIFSLNNNNNNNNTNTNNNNNGNVICVFECAIVNLATYRQFTNAAWDWIIKKKKKQEKQKTKTKTKQNKTKQNKSRKRKKIKNALSLGYPSSHF